MREHDCESCVFVSDCDLEEPCFAFLTLDSDDWVIELYHQHEKDKYYEEWIQYIEEFSN